MDRESIKKEAIEKVDEEERKQEVEKVARLIRTIRENKKISADSEKALEEYLAGKPLIRIKEDNNGDITICNGYSTGNGGITIAV